MIQKNALKTITFTTLIMIGAPAIAQNSGFTWCAAKGGGSNGAFWFFSDIFQSSDNLVSIETAFQASIRANYSQYVQPNSNFRTVCQRASQKATASAARDQDAVAGRQMNKVIMTGWTL